MRILLSLITLAVLAVNCGAETNHEPFKIGGILILTGEGASVGNASRNGALLAVEKINATGGLLGRPLEIDFQDDGGDPKTTLAAFRNLVDSKGVKFILGPTWSNTGEVVIEPADRKGILVFSPSLGMAKFNESSKFLFNTWPHDYLLSQSLAELVFRDGHRNVAMVGAEHVWVKEQTEAFRKRFEELGGKIGYIVEPAPGTTDLRSEALRIKNAPGIDAYVSTTDGVVVGSLVAKFLKEVGVHIPTYSITLDQSAIDASSGGFEGLKFLTSLTPTKQFQTEYEARFKVGIDIGADSAYDAVTMIADAIRQTKSFEPRVVAEHLSRITTYSGVSGELTSDGKRGFTKPFALKKVVDGKGVNNSEH